ncbi:MAG: CPBP family intramembrane metalloprotease [Ignavibacteria bacterium]|nr:CPBP family intramembrane metalloprotease [Ignavibacteria bacterium]
MIDTDRHTPGDSFVERNEINPFVFAFLTLFITFVLYQLVAGGLTYLIVGDTNITRENVGRIRLLTMLGQVFFILIPTLWFARLLSSDWKNVFPWKLPRLPEMFFAVLGLVFLQQIFHIYLFLQDRIPLPESLKRLIDPIRQMLEELYRTIVSAESVPELLFVLLIVAIVPAIVEELFFRGLIQSTFDRVLSPLWSAIIVGFIFGFYHLNPFAVIPLIGIGCYFGLLRYRTGSVALAIIAHFLNNALAVTLVYFHLDDGAMFPPRSGGEQPESGALIVQLVLFVMLFAVSVYAFYRVTSRDVANASPPVDTGVVEGR